MTMIKNVKLEYKPCECGCGELIHVIDSWERSRRFKSGHNSKGRRGSTHPCWKGGRIKRGNYWALWMPDYYKTYNKGYVAEHVYFYEQKNKLCMLDWGEVHHIEPVTKNYCNNMPWNLQGMMEGEHMSFHNLDKHIDTSDRRCFACGSSETYITQPTNTNKTPYPHWRHLPWDKENWYCQKCYDKSRKKKY